MSYTALYRKWRPISFADVVGQDAIIKTLLNQISTGRIAHAYLFCGTRGTGKTTTAKIFSRAVNCESSDELIPCNKCTSCTSILEERNMDVFEMDAASNNGVDDIRELREHVKYPPSNGRYKVYIIDEVHMLSKGAFNALLKTLEEPPPHIIFILATTEPHKIPPTIHSRCQRFDFKRVSYDSVAALLKEICDKEGRVCEKEALRLIVQASEGAMRDALSILDRCLSFEERDLTHERVLEILGLSGDLFLKDLVEALLLRDTDGILKSISTAVTEGKDLNQLIREMVEFFRKLLLVNVSKSSEQLLDVSTEMHDALKHIAAQAGTAKLMNWLSQASRLESESKWTPHPRALLEMTLVRMLYDASSENDTTLLMRIEALEDKLRSIEMGKAFAGVKADRNERTDRIVNVERASLGESSIPAQKEQDKMQAASQQKPVVNEKPAVSVQKPLGVVEGDGNDMQMILRRWPEIMSALKKIRVSTYALMSEGELTDYKHPTLTVSFGEQFEFHRLAMEKEENRIQVEQAIEQVLGLNIRLACMAKPSAGGADEKDAELTDAVKAFFKGYEDKITINGKED